MLTAAFCSPIGRLCSVDAHFHDSWRSQLQRVRPKSSSHEMVAVRLQVSPGTQACTKLNEPLANVCVCPGAGCKGLPQPRKRPHKPEKLYDCTFRRNRRKGMCTSLQALAAPAGATWRVLETKLHLAQVKLGPTDDNAQLRDR